MILFEDLMLRYLAELKAQGRDVTRQKDASKALFMFFADRDLAKLKGVDITGYTAFRREFVMEATIKRELGVLSALINYARREWELLLPNPVSGRLPVVRSRRVRFLSIGEARRLIESAKQESRAPYLAAFIVLALQTGARSGELLGAEWSHFDFDNSFWNLPGFNEDGTRRAKSARVRSVKLTPLAVSVLSELSGLPVKSERWVFCHQRDKLTKTGSTVPAGSRIESIKRAFRTSAKRAGLGADVTPHTLRHTVASWLALDGVSLQKIGLQLGQSTAQVTEYYAHLNDKALDETSGKLHELLRAGLG